MSGGRASSVGYEFDSFVSTLLNRVPHFDGTSTIVETKVDTPSTRERLQDIVNQLHAMARVHGHSTVRLVLAVPGVLAPAHQAFVAQQDIDLWDGPWLVKTAKQVGLAIPSVLRSVSTSEPVAEPSPAADLLQQLAAIPGGKPMWSQYQQLCKGILDYLFCPPLEHPHYEHATASKIERRDIVLANYATDGFWSFMRTHYQADFIVADAKNFQKRVGKREVLQMANYLTRHGTGLFGMIMTRVGADRSAEWTCREQWVLQNKLIIVLNDVDVEQMLTAKDAGEDPSRVVRQTIEQFRLRV